MSIFISLNFDLLNSRSLPYGGLKFGYSFKTQYYFIACCTRLPTWQDHCYRASRELCSNYLLSRSQYLTKLRYSTNSKFQGSSFAVRLRRLLCNTCAASLCQKWNPLSCCLEI